MTNNKDEFKVLTDRDHLLLRPQMYAGSISNEPYIGIIDYKYQSVNITPALVKIISELIDNAVDECIRMEYKIGNKVDVTVKQEGLGGWVVSVEDNGRGIPIERVGGSYRPVLAWTTARAGSNFGATRETIGANGIGSYISNVFSQEFIGETWDGKQYLKLTCTENAKNIDHTVSTLKTPKNGTKVTISPDLEFFDGLTDISSDHLLMISDRLQNLSVCYPKITFSFNGKKMYFHSAKDLGKKYAEEFVSTELKNGIVIISSNSEQEFRLLSYVNGLHIKNGGTHVDWFMNSLIEEMRPIIKKKWKIDVLPNQLRQNLLFISFFRGFQNLKFDSQSKERITNNSKEISEFFSECTPDYFKKLSKDICNTPFIIDPAIEAILYKKDRDDAREAAKKLKGAKKKKIANHIEAMSKNVEEKICFLTEGNSATGFLLAVRNSQIHGAYALRGKVMNVNGMKKLDIAKNKEYNELMSILGLEFNEPADNITYGKIGILTDFDPDGHSIYCMLLNFFALWPDVLKKRIYRVESPLYIATKGKNIKNFYSQKEYDDAKLDKSWSIEYIKGLGSLSKEAYREVINNPRLISVTAENKEDFDSLEMAFGNSADARKNWLAS